ncbi:hypothetical protein O6H91_15G004800 [Diphasiastrum complanatum]|uniref:Uncharacterized protein n=2 Tax=Diphasiastrum complanatum TaxID=34168 RepID=A0ACC2BFE7_DIPCM|nr:hypothetical protein O6H91_15G004400 [Diphasiastrum complanatum]KAJ7528458.1 hypothetical protein O6H91_15G004800 [Diphasiastrum complanatum]
MIYIMDAGAKCLLYCIKLLLFLISIVNYESASAQGLFQLNNKCTIPVWVGTQSNAGQPVLGDANVALEPGMSATVATPPGWAGRFWGRTGCTFDSTTGQGTCLTGDCGGELQCSGVGGDPPATLAEFTLFGADGLDFYDVSLVDGYNLPLAVAPTTPPINPELSSDYSCGSAGCTGDLNENCPTELQVLGSGGQVVGCRSACSAFGTPEYCCTGDFGSPTTCLPTSFSQAFKSACPRAYSYAYDDASSTFTCVGSSYILTFCP